MYLGSAALANDPSLAYITVEDDGIRGTIRSSCRPLSMARLFNLPAGPVECGVWCGDAIRQAVHFPGNQAVARNYFGQSTSGVTKGQDATSELYTELEIPLLKGMPLVESFTANLSGRYTHIRSAGDDTTYKVGLNWQVVPSFRVRGTYGTSYRGPALFENYLAAQTSFTSASDPCGFTAAIASPATRSMTTACPKGWIRTLSQVTAARRKCSRTGCIRSAAG